MYYFVLFYKLTSLIKLGLIIDIIYRLATRMKAVLEQITQDFRHSFHCAKHEGLQFDSPWHYHPQWELTYITKGTGILYIGNTIRNFCEGELVLVGQNLPHCWRNEAIEDETVESTFFQWDENLLGEHWLAHPEFLAIASMLSQSHKGILFDSKATANVIKKIKGLTQLSPFDRLWQFVAILHELSAFDTKVISHEADFAINHQVSKRIDKLINFVENNYQNQISAADLANITYLTPSSFSKFFRKTFQKTFTAYLNELRISKACILLRNSDRQVEDIAFSCGYNNMAFFHRRFKKMMGTTPALYRKSLALIAN